MQPVDRLTVHVVVDNTTDMLSSRPKHIASEPASPEGRGDDGGSQASALLGPPWAVPGGLCALGRRSPHRALRCGPGSLCPSSAEWPAHAPRFLGRIEALVLSHGHFDHSEGLVKAVELIRGANGGHSVPLYVHPGAFVKRGLRLPSGELLPFQDVPPRHTLEEHGARVVVSVEAEEIVDGLFLSQW